MIIEFHLTVSLHGSDMLSIQEQVYVGEVRRGSAVHHHLVQHQDGGRFLLLLAVRVISTFAEYHALETRS